MRSRAWVPVVVSDGEWWAAGLRGDECCLFFTSPPDRPPLTCYYKQKNPKVIGLQLPLATPSGRLNPLYRGYRSPPG